MPCNVYLLRAVKLTTARYYTPNGRSIQAKGIVPDITLEDNDGKGALLKMRESDLSRHLLNQFDEKADRKSTRLNSSHVKRSRMPSSA